MYWRSDSLRTGNHRLNRGHGDGLFGCSRCGSQNNNQESGQERGSSHRDNGAERPVSRGVFARRELRGRSRGAELQEICLFENCFERRR